MSIKRTYPAGCAERSRSRRDIRGNSRGLAALSSEGPQPNAIRGHATTWISVSDADLSERSLSLSVGTFGDAGMGESLLVLRKRSVYPISILYLNRDEFTRVILPGG